MIPARSSIDKFRSAFSGFRGFQLLLLLGVAALPLTAAAQSAGAPATATTPAPPEAPSTPAAVPAPEPPASPAAAPAPAPTPTPGSEEPAPPPEHKKKHKHRDEAEQNDRDPSLATAAPDDAPRDRPERKRDRAQRKRDEAGKHELELKGRIFVLSELSHRHETVVGTTGALVERDRNALDLSLQSARFGINYRSPLRFLSAQLELEIAGKPRVKDAFLEAGKTFFVKAGQFKVPSSVFELDSPWTLPLARRGLIHDLMTDWLDIAGRRPGVAVGYHGRSGLKPRLTLGAFQGTTLKGVVPGDRDVKLIDHASLTAQTYAARGELSLASVTLGAWFEQRVGSTVVGDFEHFSTFGLDAQLAQRLGNGALRVWLDGSGGESLYVNADKPGNDPSPWFVSGRALVGYRFGGLALGEPYVEPFGFAALLDPDTEVVSDFVTEAAIGVAAGFWDRARVTLQGVISNGQRNFPTGFLDNQNPDHSSLLLQAGARF
ncbi:MAG: hypothetical protein ABUL60_11070 [Myxococcales bacterium]